MTDKTTSSIQPRPAVSVIVPCYNAAPYFHETLDAILAQAWDQRWELIVADNRSTDNSRAIAEDYALRYPNMRVITANEGQGTSYAINAGVEAARGRSVLFCDSDDVPSPGWLAAMGTALETQKFVACRMDITSLNHNEEFAPRSHPQTERLMKIAYPPYLHHAGGSTMGVRRTLFLDIGGYDPKFVYLHETDFCFRVQLVGHELSFVPEAVLKVRFRRDKRSAFYQSLHWGQYNMLLFRKYRNYGKPLRRRWNRLLRDSQQALRLFRRWHRLTPGEQMNAIWSTGWLLGKIKGIFLYRMAPY